MLQLVSPQKAVNTAEGYTVQIADRFHVEYVDNRGIALVEVDFGQTVGVYAKTLTHWREGETRVLMNEEEKTLVLSRLVNALQAMGNSEVEICQ